MAVEKPNGGVIWLLDMIISVGYRVKSKRGIAFRKWANSVLKNYIIKGYAVNHNRMNRLGEVIRIMKRTENSLDAKQVLSVIERYSLAPDLLDDYDHQAVLRPKGNEKDESFKGSIGNIYQSFVGTLCSKAARLPREQL